MHPLDVLKSSLCAVALAALTLSPAHAAGMPGQGTWETTLKARDINGDSVVDAWYDTALNITWLANWNANGAMDNWYHATTWAAGLNVYGETGWRLPSTTDTGAPGCDFSYAGGTDCGYNVDTASSEMAHMFHVTLGNKSDCPPGNVTCTGPGVPQPGSGLTNTANFVGMQFSLYWSGTEYAPNPSVPWHLGNRTAWYFSTSGGLQGADIKDDRLYAVAVRPGDVAVVPEPQTVALLLAGLTALLVARRRRPG